MEVREGIPCARFSGVQDYGRYLAYETKKKDRVEESVSVSVSE